ncbi:glycosyltransferase [Subsaxibacter sp. CAU 1640]|uniref:glycosyltransferase n=1 Tax=Subsaxibacter sp. CAU 1640 TaxID=2933271 RepID=UPI002004A016|nr:glycosyltransferase [Subsaxibacter sp. CAU 1640]MCK7591506.1 glycosyltransferase [Subsaxibacter sp. CAU 1640]
MKILLVGEFSRLHNSLKEGLIALGHDVFLVGSGDQFKNFPVDANIDSIVLNKGLPFLIRKVIFRFTKKDIAHFEIAHRFKKILHKLKDYDVVQLINEDALTIHPKKQIELLQQLKNQNKSMFLLCCGDDYTTVSYANEKKYRYSYLTPYFEGKVSKKTFNYSLKYLTKPYVQLHNFLKKHIKGAIATDMDYHLPMLGKDNYLGLIPNPVNVDALKYSEIMLGDKIIIFHGVNKHNYYKKGNDIFDEALEIIKQKFDDKVDIIKTESLPYDDYIKIYDSCHILLDQVYAYDQGYNALEAMAKGKVVFTGAEKEWLDYYGLKEDTVAINALPNAKKIADKLEWLILNPEKITEISKNARAFIEQEHHYVRIAERYIDTWTENR